MADKRPWIVVAHKGGRRRVMRFESHAEAHAKATKLRRERYSPVMVFHATRGR